MVKHAIPLFRLPRALLIALVRVYQATLSPDHGPLKNLHPHGYCRHEPTCSMYAIEMLEKRGAIVGSLLAFRRVLSCNPWNKPSDAKIKKTLGVG